MALPPLPDVLPVKIPSAPACNGQTGDEARVACQLRAIHRLICIRWDDPDREQLGGSNGERRPVPAAGLHHPHPPRRWINLPPPNPADGIPIQAKSRYRYYLRVTKINEFLSFGKGFQLGLQMYAYTGTDKNNFSFTKVSADQDLTATLTWTPAPAGYPQW
ncbi:uncharacterized protein BDZ99DRAFT_573622 [Mytilinidion resinicola]|uniref:Uncharacterized protein n=1 Tax=Mytilinidion resinicola TaxID=574789 RepID=A0A6A6YGA8_9PEZI|nr:uncharacterized protein BDZ99DRAFT_573622 [Mytilinidion resinicola]KAF2806927.1 hypothetical protein BDZ99DRAFT_573622 [Mytilinidion resinicola]